MSIISGYLGCMANDSNFNSSLTLNVPWMTATQCIQYCLGQLQQFSVLQGDNCFCINSSDHFTHQNQAPCQGCSGHSAHACGSKNANLFSLYKLGKYIF